MTERPIIMSGESLGALKAGRKTQTRRPIKPQPIARPNGAWWWDFPGGIGAYPDYMFLREALVEHCPYGQPGDRLRVKEQWRVADIMPAADAQSFEFKVQYRADNAFSRWIRLTAARVAQLRVLEVVRFTEDWKQSIFLPREFSRFTLELTEVRAQRLQDITFDDILAEGWDVQTSQPWTGGTAGEDARAWYMARWDFLNAERGYPWLTNPWVWVLTFKVLEVRG